MDGAEQGVTRRDRAIASTPPKAATASDADEVKGTALPTRTRFGHTVRLRAFAFAFLAGLWLVACSSPSPGELVAKGDKLAGTSEWEGAIRKYDAAIKKDDKFVPAYVARSKALVEVGRLPDALADYDTVARLEPPRTEELRSRLSSAFVERGGDNDGDAGIHSRDKEL